MSIEGKHSYRFVYLTSEEWATVRVEALAREKACCQICGVEDISNDAHHVYYPKSFWETTADHLIILCRPCHNIMHAVIHKIGDDREIGYSRFTTVLAALKTWRVEKQCWLSTALPLAGPKELRAALQKQHEILRKEQSAHASTKSELHATIRELERQLWRLNKPVDDDDLFTRYCTYQTIISRQPT